jgi:hypothetical protein
METNGTGVLASQLHRYCRFVWHFSPHSPFVCPVAAITPIQTAIGTRAQGVGVFMTSRQPRLTSTTGPGRQPPAPQWVAVQISICNPREPLQKILRKNSAASPGSSRRLWAADPPDPHGAANWRQGQAADVADTGKMPAAGTIPATEAHKD